MLNDIPPISIHAPLRGRLEKCLSGHFFQAYFNPRPLAGATWCKLDFAAALLFQSTPPCGGDYGFFGPCSWIWHFNPRPLAGATSSRQNHGFVKKISIHAPLRGRRVPDHRLDPGFGISIHAPLRGRLNVKFGGVSDEYFNPRPLAGATIAGAHIVPGTSGFQSTPPCGGDG